MDLSIGVFMAKRNWMNLMFQNKRIPFATQRPRDPITGRPGATAVDFNDLVFTIGLIGANEMAQYHTGAQLHESEESVRFTIKALLEMKKHLKELQTKYGIRLALARTPAESSAQRLAVADMTSPEFGDKSRQVIKGDMDTAKAMMSKGRRDVAIYYSNGTHTYVGGGLSLADRINIEHKFFPVLDGGNMFHVWMGEENPDAEALLKLTKKIAVGTQLGYFAYTKDLTMCVVCGAISGGLKDKCGNCGSWKVEWWSRITGYYQNVSGWNKAKKRELIDRHRTKISF
jgi:ribonucleoside-triphosphate reductase